MSKGEFLLPQRFYEINFDFKLFLLNSDGSVYCSFQKFDRKVYCPQTDEYYDSTTLKPLLNSYVDK